MPIADHLGVDDLPLQLGEPGLDLIHERFDHSDRWYSGAAPSGARVTRPTRAGQSSAVASSGPGAAQVASFDRARRDEMTPPQVGRGESTPLAPRRGR
jgi:hypothetical protein